MYFVTILDYYGNPITVQVSREIYEVYQEDRRREERERFERRKHLDRRSLEDYIPTGNSNLLSPSPEELFETMETLRTVLAVVRTCTPAQQRRFYLFALCGWSYAEIAKAQGCNERVVRKSIHLIRKKFFREGSD